MAVHVETIEQTMATTATPTWQIDPVHSAIEFAVKHMMFSTATGRFNTFAGAIVFDEADPARTSVAVEIQTGSVDTRDERRDAHIRSGDFFEAETYPTATFVSTRVDPIGANGYRVTGDLTLRGVTRQVTLDAELSGRGQSPWGTEVIGFSATTMIDRRDYGVTFNAALETGGFLLGDEVKLTLNIQAFKEV